jgi:predicted O-linked N-acetylglucosamine transferase (SPINDLY family)
MTFGCLNNAAKISDVCMDTWVKLLKEVPHSRLVLLAGQSQVGAKRLTDRFIEAGVPGDRVQLVLRLPKNEYFEAYQLFDLALDPFPYNGGVTTCDALWMGVPVLAVAGNSYVSRQGAAILTHAGLGEFVADSPEMLVALAKTWGENRDVLAEIRAGLRQQLAKSPVADGPGYVRGLEAALRRAWKERVK